MRYVIQITARGDIEAVELFGTAPSLKELQELVGGGIETVPAKHGVLIVNGDNVCGELSVPPINATATAMLRSDIHRYVGGACVLVQSDGERLIGFSKELAQRIISSLREGVNT